MALTHAEGFERVQASVRADMPAEYDGMAAWTEQALAQLQVNPAVAAAAAGVGPLAALGGVVAGIALGQVVAGQVHQIGGEPWQYPWS